MNQLLIKADRLLIKVIRTSEFSKPEMKKDSMTGNWYATGNTTVGRICSFMGKTQMTKSEHEEKGFLMVYWGETILNDGWYLDCNLRITNIKNKKTENWERSIELVDWKKSPVLDIEDTKLSMSQINLNPKAPTDIISSDEFLEPNESDNKQIEWFE